LEKRLKFPEVRLRLTVVIEFLLIIAFDLERDGFVELELRSSVQSQKFLAVEFEFDKHDATGFVSVSLLASFAVVLLVCDLSILEERGVEECGFFCLAIEPEAGGDLGGHFVVDAEFGSLKELVNRAYDVVARLLP
jgi:hypothetical protein